MPSVNDAGLETFLEDPMGLVAQLCEKHYRDGMSREWDELVRRDCARLFESNDDYNKLPLLNTKEYHQLKNYQVVRFRCMIQDMFDPEFYLGILAAKNLKSGETKKKFTLFREKVQAETFEELHYDDRDNPPMERRLFYCVSVPGENDWVKEGWLASEILQSEPVAEENEMVIDAPTSGANKRQLDCEGGGMDGLNEGAGPSSPKIPTTEASRPDASQAKVVRRRSPQETMNFPLPDMFGKSKGCIAKVYDQKAKLTLNQVVEFLGILILDPGLNVEDRCEDSDLLPVEMGTGPEEMEVRNPPPSLIPRLHVISQRLLPHINPTVPLTIPRIHSGVREARRDLKDFLTDVFFGDALCAEYTILNMISYVYRREGTLPVGKLSLNLVAPLGSVLAGDEHTAFLSEVLRSLLSKTLFLDLNLDTLNTSTFIPKKDYKENRLKSGILQLSAGTHLLMRDKMLAGELDATGYPNMNALLNLTSSQRIDYDFQYYKLEFQMDIPIIVLSEDVPFKLLPCDVVLPIRMSYDAGRQSEAKNRINSLLGNQAFMTRMRNYLTQARGQPYYRLEESEQLMIEEDFARSLDPETLVPELTGSDLHTLLTLSRIMCLSFGMETLDEDTWFAGRDMERERKNRLNENRHN